MTAEEFRELALSFEGAVEGSHMGHPDFRVAGKIFATLGPDLTWGMAKLTPDQQSDLIRQHPKTFEPAPGKWGEGGATKIILAHADAEAAGEAITLAWQNTAVRS
ncbi:MAG: MmcQ/YjbR family DNA-binding protein [Chloracidobacterium sp.]|nr:MmcQ/YjbR family DNA-binding protein [Chloracidobacterium sp.]